MASSRNDFVCVLIEQCLVELWAVAARHNLFVAAAHTICGTLLYEMVDKFRFNSLPVADPFLEKVNISDLEVKGEIALVLPAFCAALNGQGAVPALP
uniref:Uncharacterized protein n=1 Tax=Timema shepardi TaxID=629360 RepID=A0A7R9ANV5_TIMSH|nr:unnamed protein product [Timema shepardi]